MKKYSELKYNDEQAIARLRPVLREIKSAVTVEDDYRYHPYRRPVRCVDEVVVISDGEVFLKMDEENGVPPFWVPARMIDKGHSTVQMLGDQGKLMVYKIWAVYIGWK